MTKYLFYIIGLWLFCSCSDSTPGEEPPVTPPEPTPTITISKPKFVFGFTGESKYSYCPSALKQEDGSVHLFFCGNPENQIMVDNIFHIKINPDGSQTAPKSVLQPGMRPFRHRGQFQLEQRDLQICHVLPEQYVRSVLQ